MEHCICAYLPEVETSTDEGSISEGKTLNNDEIPTLLEDQHSIENELDISKDFEQALNLNNNILPRKSYNINKQKTFNTQISEISSTKDSALTSSVLTAEASNWLFKTQESQVEQVISPDNININNVKPQDLNIFDDTTTASKVLAVQAQNWQLKRKLAELEESTKCLEQKLREDWAQQNKICYEIQKLKTQRKKIITDIKKQFTAHVLERNRLVLDITRARQNNMLIIQEINLADSKYKKLKIQRNEAAACLYKATVAFYNNTCFLEDTASNENSSIRVEDSITESESENLLTSSISHEKNSSSIDVGSDDDDDGVESVLDTTIYSTLECSSNISSTASGTETEPEFNAHENLTPSTSATKKENLITFEQQKITVKPAEIRLDLSCMEKGLPVHQYTDSGISEVTNMATQISTTTTTMCIIEATTPNILE